MKRITDNQSLPFVFRILHVGASEREDLLVPPEREDRRLGGDPLRGCPVLSAETHPGGVPADHHPPRGPLRYAERGYRRGDPGVLPRARGVQVAGALPPSEAWQQQLEEYSPHVHQSGWLYTL